MKGCKFIVAVLAIVISGGCATVQEARRVQSGNAPLMGETTVRFEDSGLEIGRAHV